MSGGKNVRHGRVDKADQITDVTNLASQVFEHVSSSQADFRPVPRAWAHLQLKKHRILPGLHFLTTLKHNPIEQDVLHVLRLHESDTSLFEFLFRQRQKVILILKNFAGRGYADHDS